MTGGDGSAPGRPLTVRAAHWVTAAVPLVAAGAAAAIAALPVATALPAAVLACAAASGLGRVAARPSGRTGWSVPMILLAVVLLALATDVVALGPRWIPYAMAGVLGLAVLCGPRTGARLPGDPALALLLVWGLAGSLCGRLILDQQDNALALFLPLLIALAHRWRPLPLGAADQARRVTGILLVAGIGYTVLSYAVLVHGWSGLPVADFRHETLYFIAMAVAAAALLRAWIVLIGVAGLAGAEFLAYPALTWVVVGAATAVLGLLAIRRWGPMLLGFGALAAVVVGSLASLTMAQLRVGYFSSVGKTDNTPTREVLWRAGAERFLDSPIVGDSFTRDIAVPSTVTGASRLVPVHNDYLQLAMSGGILGTALFLAWCVATIVVGIRLVRSLRERGLTEQAALAMVVTAGIVSMLATALFNPVLIDTRSSLLLGLLHYILASLRLTAPGRSCPAGPGGVAMTGMRR